MSFVCTSISLKVSLKYIFRSLYCSYPVHFDCFSRSFLPVPFQHIFNLFPVPPRVSFKFLLSDLQVHFLYLYNSPLAPFQYNSSLFQVPLEYLSMVPSSVFPVPFVCTFVYFPAPFLVTLNCFFSTSPVPCLVPQFISTVFLNFLPVPFQFIFSFLPVPLECPSSSFPGFF